MLAKKLCRYYRSSTSLRSTVWTFPNVAVLCLAMLFDVLQVLANRPQLCEIKSLGIIIGCIARTTICGSTIAAAVVISESLRKTVNSARKMLSRG